MQCLWYLNLILCVQWIRDVRTQDDDVTVGCGSSKICLTVPDGCSGTDCEMVVTYRPTSGDSTEFQLYAKVTDPSNSLYVSAGLSKDAVMGEDSVIDCMYMTESDIRVGLSWNQANKGQIDVLTDAQVDATITSSSTQYANGKLLCTVTRLNSPTQDKVYDLNEAPFWYLLLAGGSIDGATGLKQYHGANKISSSSAVDLTAELDVAVGCGSSKGCFLVPDGCSGDPYSLYKDACEMAVTYRQTGGDSTEFQVYSYVNQRDTSSSFYISAGLSIDAGMGDDTVIDCIYMTESDIRVGLSWNNGTAKGIINVLTDAQNTATITSPRAEYVNGKLMCTVTLPNASNQEKVYNLNAPYYLLLAQGEANPDGGKNYHGPNKRFSGSAVDLASVDGASGVGILDRDKKIHATLMIVAWCMFAGVGILTARYFKSQWPEQTCCGVKPWFRIHQTFMSLCFLSTVAGFIVIFYHEKKWAKMLSNPEFLRAHTPVGTVVMFLVLLNPLIALCRPHPEAKRRPIFNVMHTFIGSAAFILGMFNVMLGISLPQSAGFVRDWMIYLVTGLILFHIVCEVLLALRMVTLRKDDSDGDKSQSSVIMSIALLLYGIATLAVVMALVVGIWWDDIQGHIDDH